MLIDFRAFAAVSSDGDKEGVAGVDSVLSNLEVNTGAAILFTVDKAVDFNDANVGAAADELVITTGLTKSPRSSETM